MHAGISRSLHCYYVSSMPFWRDVARIRRLIAVNINFWALGWCNFLSRSGRISRLGCRRERPPWVMNEGGCSPWRKNKWLWSLCILWHAIRTSMHTPVHVHIPLLLPFPLWLELHTQRRTARSYLRHVCLVLRLYILVGLFSDIPLPLNRK